MIPTTIPTPLCVMRSASNCRIASVDGIDHEDRSACASGVGSWADPRPAYREGIASSRIERVRITWAGFMSNPLWIRPLIQARGRAARGMDTQAPKKVAVGALIGEDVSPASPVDPPRRATASSSASFHRRREHCRSPRVPAGSSTADARRENACCRRPSAAGESAFRDRTWKASRHRKWDRRRRSSGNPRGHLATASCLCERPQSNGE